MTACNANEASELKSETQPKEVQVTDQPIPIVIETSAGNIELELYPDKAPVSVKNFLGYVESGFYDNTIFHRVIRGFMIQGGGFDKDHAEKQSGEPIVNEAGNGLKNLRGTIAYARTNVVNSATAQFFINHGDNASLNHQNETQAGFGYAVFGKVTKGIEVVDKIAGVKTGTKKMTIMYQGQKKQQPYQDVPLEPVIVKSIKVVQ
ncbi:peptidyl-prolyl cis-trans isomerase [candidate division KSB1 bacterium]|nr:peptidyl-prolyl cis-trans isomerase [candidate division KSB1 bacterium]